MYKTNPYNFSDITPSGALKDLNFINSVDQEEFALFGVATIYYKLKDIQENFDGVYRDMLSSKVFEEPLQVRSFFKVEESTTHGLTDTGAVQTAERTGKVTFNVTLIEKLLGRSPVIGDVVENLQLHQKFEIYGISKEVHRLGVPLRYILSVRLYQDTK